VTAACRDELKEDELEEKESIDMRRTKWLPVVAIAASLALAPMARAKSQPPDSWLTTKTKIAVLGKVGTAGTRIHVDTVDGRVTLHGHVRDASEKEAAEKAARAIDGVKEVRNLLQVVPAKNETNVEATDSALQDKVEKALRNDPFLKDSKIVVQSVNNGTVLLAGKADSLSMHLRALEDARDVRGVRRVASEIESPDAKGDEQVWKRYESTKEAVGSAASSTKSKLSSAANSTKSALSSAATSVKDTATDMYITSAAKMRLLTDSETPGSDINVDTDRGVVTLFGTVPNTRAKQKAEMEARKVSGVKKVVNELQVVPSGVKKEVSQRDSQIASEAEHAVSTDRSLKDADIQVQVRDGVARLTGTVPSANVKMAAVSKVKRIDGVRKVEDDLQVKSD
jgi:hyperosmotically inducible protein